MAATQQKPTPKAFTIERSSSAVMVRILSIIVVAEVIFALVVLTMSLISDGDTIGPLFWILLFGKLVLVLVGVGITTQQHSAIQYYVRNQQLVMQSVAFKKFQERYQIKYIRTVKVDQKGAGKQFNYGDIDITMSGSEFSDKLTLQDVDKPNEYAKYIQDLNISIRS